MLANPEAVKRAIEMFEKGVVPGAEVEEEKIDIPEDLFSIIEGFDDIKKIIITSLKSEKPVHILLVGPPATAKSLFLTELARLKGSYLVLASTATRAGIRDVLIEITPRILLIDELDKISDPKELAVLLSWMESGLVTVTMKTMRTKVCGRGWVIAAANTTRGIPPELLSRFLIFRIKPYTEEQLHRVIMKTLTMRENIDKELAKYIAEKIVKELRSRDPRDAVKIARMAKTKKDVDFIIEVMKKYR